MQFYLIFPLLVKAYQKKPVVSFAVMTAIGIVYRSLLVNNSSQPSMYLNQLPAFFDVIAIGFLAAYLVVYINKNIEYQKYSFGFTIISIMSFGWVLTLMRQLAGLIGHETIQRWQGQLRFTLAIAFGVLLVSTIYACFSYRRIFSNRLMIFLSSVSYNYYIWHQYIAVRLKQFKFPPYLSEMPNVMAEKPWQWTYTASAFIIPLITAIVLTWAIDKKIVPAVQQLLAKKSEDIK